MDRSRELVSQQDLMSILGEYISKTTGLTFERLHENEISLTQKADQKMLKIKRADLMDILLRRDPEGKEFIQVNLVSGSKILVTDQLIGFKPHHFPGLEENRLPKVVTTVDLVSVIEAIEETAALIGQADKASEDIEVLRGVFKAIVMGGEQIGFDLTEEKTWLKRIPATSFKASA